MKSKPKIKFQIDVSEGYEKENLPFAIGELTPRATDSYITNRTLFNANYGKEFTATVTYSNYGSDFEKRYDFIAKSEDVFAVPVKTNSATEILICLLLTTLFLFFLPYKPADNQVIIGLGLGFILGVALGRHKQSKQQAAADKFNASE